MNLRDKGKKAGQLVLFSSKEKGEDNFSIFFPVEGLLQYDDLREVINGFEKCGERYRDQYELATYSIADINGAKDILSNIDDTKTLTFELEEFLNEKHEFIDRFGATVFERSTQKNKQVFPNIRTGALATGSNFYNRLGKVEEMWTKLVDGINLALQAPRRYGKSSLLRYIVDNPRPGWNANYIDLEGATSSNEFVEYILKGLINNKHFDNNLPKHLCGRKIWIKKDKDKLAIIQQERPKIRNDWRSYAETLFMAMCPKDIDRQFLLILDEFSWFIEDMNEETQDTHEIEEFMKWFQEVRKKYNRLSFIISGSEHLPTFLDSLGINNYINDLHAEHLDLLGREESRELIFLALAGQGIVTHSDEIDYILELMGEPIPFFLQVFLDLIIKTCKERQMLAREDIEAIYSQELLGPESKRYFEGIQRQLYRYTKYGPGAHRGAIAILDALASEEYIEKGDLEAIWSDARNGEGNFQVILSILHNDFYVEEVNSDIYIGSKLLKDWWRRHALARSG